MNDTNLWAMLAQESGAIMAIGRSQEEATEKFESVVRDDPDHDAVYLASITASLHQAVQERGGLVRWAENADGLYAPAEEVEAERLRHEVAIIVDSQDSDDPDRREMYETMARAMLDGGSLSDRVALSNKGKLRWTDQAPKRRDMRAVFNPLADNPVQAATEMSVNLGIAKWAKKFEAKRRQEARATYFDLDALGRAIFDNDWISPAARALDIDVRTVQRWVSDQDAPAWVKEQLPLIAINAEMKADRLRKRAATIERFAAQAPFFGWDIDGRNVRASSAQDAAERLWLDLVSEQRNSGNLTEMPSSVKLREDGLFVAAFERMERVFAVHDAKEQMAACFARLELPQTDCLSGGL